MIGRVVGKYRLLAQLGEGGMGTVYRAEHVVLGSPAAVKILLPQFSQDPVVVDRFFQEARAASAIRHAGIVEVFDFGRLPTGQAYLAMELLRGEELSTSSPAAASSTPRSRSRSPCRCWRRSTRPTWSA